MKLRPKGARAAVVPAKKHTVAAQKPVERAPLDAAAFTGPLAAAAQGTAGATEEVRAHAGFAALKQAVQGRDSEIQRAEKQFGPAETWSSKLLQEQPQLLPLLPHIHLNEVRKGNFDGAAKLAEGNERLTPSQKDTLATMWHTVRDAALKLANDAIEFAKKNPGKAAVLGTGVVAVGAVALWAAPAIAAAVAQWLAPLLGAKAAAVVGTGVAGSVASGTRSLTFYSAPMLLGVDPLNTKQLAGDVSLSAGFGFVGFAQAQGLTLLTSALGAGGLEKVAMNAVGLVGMEVLKDFLQNGARNAMGTASSPKSWTGKVDAQTGAATDGIWKSAVMAETATNLLRAIPGLETSFAMKVGGDAAGTIWWDRIVNGRKKDEPETAAPAAK